MSTSPYRDFCSRRASQRLQERNAGRADAPATDAAADAAPAKPGMRDRLKSLKDRLGEA